jgi:hypothetical protein
MQKSTYNETLDVKAYMGVLDDIMCGYSITYKWATSYMRSKCMQPATTFTHEKIRC